MTGRRVLIYSHDTFGLGNIRRMLEVARHLTESSPDVSVLVVTGSPMLHAFRIPARIDYIKLPCLSRDVDGRYAARSLDLSLPGTVRLRANLIRSAIADFAPDVVVVDKKPFGVEDELAGALSELQPPASRPKMVLLLRDILDSPEATSRIWRKNGYFEAIGAYYDQVLVVGSQDVFDLTREYEFPPLAAAKVRFCGYIARRPGRQARAEVRAALEVPGADPLVLVTPGGGEDGYALVRAAVQALALLPEDRRPRAHIVCGPQMPEAQRREVFDAVRALPRVSVQEFCDDMMSLVGAADIVLAMGGYNTVCELLSAGRRAVLVPRVRPGKEQLIRAERLAAMGLVSMVHPDRLDAQALAGALEVQLRAHMRGKALARLRRLNGLEGVTEAIFGLIGLRRPLPALVHETPRPRTVRQRVPAQAAWA